MSGTAHIEPVCLLRRETHACGFLGELFADQERLNGPDDVFGEVIAHRPCSFGLTYAVDYFDFKANLFRLAIVIGDEQTVDVEQALHFGIDAFEERVWFEGGAQRAADFVQNV